jgi:hypothetical protein
MLNSNLYEIDNTVAGKTIATKGTNVNIRSGASTTSKILKTVAASGTVVGKCSGRVWLDTDPKYKWYEIAEPPPLLPSYVRNDLATLTTTSTSSTASPPKHDDAEAQQLLDDIVAQDKETMNNLNIAAAMIGNLKAKGVNTTTSANKITAIFNSVQERQEAMKKTTWGKVKDTISNAWGSVKNFFGFNGIGILPIVIIAGIALVAGAGTTALVLIKPWKNKSNIDLKESKELKALLENADPVVAQKIREDIKTQLVDAYTIGNRQGSVSSFLSIGKYVLIAGVALWLAPKLMNYFNHRKY